MFQVFAVHVNITVMDVMVIIALKDILVCPLYSAMPAVIIFTHMQWCSRCLHIRIDSLHNIRILVL